MHLGVNENTILNVFHPDALDRYSLCSDLRKVCIDLQDKNRVVEPQSISIFMPFKPMLASREPLQDVVSLMEGRFVLEMKIDGERMQLHKQGKIIRYWSRKGKDYTYLYEKSLSPLIQDSCFAKSVESIILDGEMVAYDPIEDKFQPFGNLKSVALDGTPTEKSARPCLVVFDIVYLNGEPLINKPLSQRVATLKKLVIPRKGHLQFVEQTPGSALQDVVNAVDTAILRREEGIVVKRTESLYFPNKRISDSWIKIKPEYVDNLADDLDIIVLGGFYCDGKRRGGIVNAFLCGLADDAHDGEKPKTFYSFCKFGTGLTDHDLSNLNKRLNPFWKEFIDVKSLPESVRFAETGEKPDVYINPEDSIICQVKASEIVPGRSYGVGFTLRFPRFVKMRDDKNWFDCMTVSELDSLRKIAEGRLTTKRVLTSNFRSSKKTKVVGPHSRRRGAAIAPQFEAANISNVKKSGDIFNGLEICVLNGTGEDIKGDHVITKHQLEVFIASNNGKVVQNPSHNTYCAVSGEMKVKVQNLIQEGTCDIVRPQWIMDCIAANRLLNFAPKYMIFTTRKTLEKLSEIVDSFGDSYFENISEEILQETLSRMSDTIVDKQPPAKRQRIVKEIDQKYFNSHSPLGLFRGWVVYLDRWMIESNNSNRSQAKANQPFEDSKLEVIERIIRFHGGEIADRYSQPNITHVVLDELARNQTFLQNYFESRKGQVSFVGSSFILDSTKK